MIPTKLRALLQRNKGRDLFDLDHGLHTFEGINTVRIVEILACYLEKTGLTISRAVAQKRMFEKSVGYSGMKRIFYQQWSVMP